MYPIKIPNFGASEGEISDRKALLLLPLGI